MAEAHAQEIADAALVDRATHRIGAKDLDGAEAILRDVIARTPPDYASETIEGDSLVVRCWVKGEFVFACFRRREELGDRKLSLVWVPNAYARARFHLAFIHIERGDFEEALAELDRGLAIEPGHPSLLLEKVQALVRVGRVGEAAEIAVSVAVRHDVLPFERGKALRALGHALIESGELDGAETAYRRSLEFDPDSALARTELQSSATSGRAARRRTPPPCRSSTLPSTRSAPAAAGPSGAAARRSSICGASTTIAPLAIGGRRSGGGSSGSDPVSLLSPAGYIIS